ncbi:leucine-rich repeat-containing protein 69 isoform X1 [Alosa sapidissima]|uniref:leucine-rich repeat-containing protein 69 isoform X1 n=2 Tax=Alosa sapidissima TaxID=34773 RepID=UPI001C0A4FC2|nr:leucine-rich repeat-containing protein 69 isoform X1 [Alosa sapidissima]
MKEMANNLIIRALSANAKSFSLSSRKISDLPKSIARLKCILALHLNNNLLSVLPTELKSLQRLTELNLGNNILLEIPVVLKHLHALRKLYLFGNKIERLPPDIFVVLTSENIMKSELYREYQLSSTEELPNLTLLNVNHNKIKVIPPQIKSLVNLEVFSIMDNLLECVPAELCCLVQLTEINLNNNKVSSLPPVLGRLSNLRKLYLARNNLYELPEGISGCKSLRILDVAGNLLTMFPTDFGFLALEELLCEGNSLVHAELMTSVQEIEVLSLKELAAREVLMEKRNQCSVVHRTLPLYPELVSMLSQWGWCAVCHKPFLTTWLECVQFVNLKIDMGMKRNLTVPVRAVLCSYTCFNEKGHSYYGIASTV